MATRKVVATGSFDDLRSRGMRFLEEASKLARLHVLLWSDEVVGHLEGRPPKYPQEERLYLLGAIRYVDQVTLVTGHVKPDAIPPLDDLQPDVWAVVEKNDTAEKRAFCESRGLAYHVLTKDELEGFPAVEPRKGPSKRKKVIVTGCYDWFHSGHVRFFEETSELGDLYVVVGHDENVRLLKGASHPMFPQDERRSSRSVMSHRPWSPRARAGWTPSRRSLGSSRTSMP